MAAGRGLTVAALSAALASAAGARPVRAAADGGETVTDRREIIVPAKAAEVVRIDNLLGRVSVRGVARPGEIHIFAEKHASTQDALGRLRVHYTAFESGEVVVDTRVELGGRERSLPLAGSGVDLVIDVPPDVAVEAKTFGGDVSASGLRSGAKLETTGGRIGVSDVHGGVVTRQLRGGQRVAAVEGDVDLDGVEGDMDLRNLGGGRVDARVVDGTIRAEDVHSGFVRLVTTTGQIVLLGVLRPGGHYDLRSYAGDVRILTTGETPAFELRARSARPIETDVPLRASRREGDWLRAEYVGRRPQPHTRTALLEVSSVLAGVTLQIQPRATPAELH
ncbi:MAG TPA: hypothetical protein VKQ32_01895 [Polyangia bacterium]|nr:hypothetical protein [Polyangia bacterium]